MGTLYTKTNIREALQREPSTAGADDLHSLDDASPESVAKMRAVLPSRRIPAAVLIPLVERADGFTVLLTQRAATLKDHAGQISFPGGRIEPDDVDAWAAALREAHEEIGLVKELVEFAGFLPDHSVVSGFRVTPCVGFVGADHQLQLAIGEVHDVFEVPLTFLLDSANHKTRQRRFGDAVIAVRDIPYGSRNIWGATAGMLMTFRRLLETHLGTLP